MKRILVMAGAVAALVLGITIAATWPLSGLLARAVYESLFPETISWEAKNAYVKCDGAIAGHIAWPQDPALACSAMHLCSNEAQLTSEQDASLLAAIRDLPHCGDP